jgi:hypothetical protein
MGIKERSSDFEPSSTSYDQLVYRIHKVEAGEKILLGFKIVPKLADPSKPRSQRIGGMRLD